MKFVFYTNSISPHQLPLAKGIVKLLGAENYRYIYTTPMTDERAKLGWGIENAEWIALEREEPKSCREWLEKCDVLISGLRDVSLFNRRSANGKKTIYCSERWFKPLSVGVGPRWRCSIDGRLRMLIPRYRRMARAIIQLAKNDLNFMLYPMGIHAARDFAWLLGCKIMDFERVPGGRFFGTGNYLDKMRLWGYFVAPSTEKRVTNHQQLTTAPTLRVLWVGRLLDWKRVDDLIRAARRAPIELHIYGTGPERERLIHLSQGVDNVFLHDPVPIDNVRELMRVHDVYALCSNAYEGWGAVVSEALEEGMRVVGTYEAGSSATILPESCLYHAGDVDALVKLISTPIPKVDIASWCARAASESLMGLVR